MIYLAKEAKESFIHEMTLSTGSLGIQESESILDKGEGTLVNGESSFVLGLHNSWPNGR